MTTVNDFTDILRIIREQPEWGEALRSALLSKEVLEMPQKLAELRATVTEFAETANKRFAALEGDVSELKSDVADLKAGQARLEGQVGRLEGTVSRLEGTVSGLEGAVSRLEGTVSGLEGSVSRLEGTVSGLEGSVSRLEGRVGNSRGTEYEIKVGKSIATTIGRRLDLLRVRILKGHLIPENTAFRDLMDTAQEEAAITVEEREDFDNIDLVLRGRSTDQSTVYVALEVSVTAGDSDISRAADRAETLRRATGETTFAAVVSANWDAPRRQLAEERGVAVVTKPEE